MTTLAVRAASAPFAFLGVLWRFSRPHTLIGTTLSILGIAAITGTGGTGDLLLTVLAGALVNLFIVGINQVEDVAIDRINKPHLPIASGDLPIGRARAIVAACAVLPVAMGITQGWVETLAVLAALAIGAAYSVPPLRLKRFPALAAGSISVVRALVVNLGVCLHFTDTVPTAVWALTLFVLPFSFAIAILKDVPDVEGDRAHRIFTFSVRMGRERVLRIGMVALTVGYLGMAVAGPLFASAPLMVAGHLIALGLLWRWSRSAFDDFTAFYMRVWGLFFCEYLLVPAAVLLG